MTVTAGVPYELDLPADAAWLQVGRTFGASVAAVADVQPDDAEDLALALSEGLSAIIALRDIAPADGGIRVTAHRDGRLHVRIEDLGESHAGVKDSDHLVTISDVGMARLDVVRALFDDLHVATTQTARLLLTFSVP